MTKRCKHINPGQTFHTCGSYAFNLHAEGIDQGEFCDVHYWQARATKAEAVAAREREACKGAGAIEPEFVAHSADELIKIARQCHGIANRLLTSNKLLSVELCKDAYRVESIARSLVDAIRARSNKGVDHG